MSSRVIPRVARAALWLIVAAGAATIAWIWLIADRSGQEKMMVSVPIGALTAVAGAIALFMVGGRWRRPARTAALVMIVPSLAVPALFRLKGLTGDFFPVLEYRYAPKYDMTLPVLPGETPAATETTPAAAAPTPEAESAPEPGPNPSADTSAPASPAAVPSAGVTASARPAVMSGSFPQFLGPDRTGVLPAIHLNPDWAAHPPKLLWKIAVGAGWSGFAVDRGVAVTQEQRGEREMVVAYDLQTGKPLWSHGDPIRYDSVIAGDGPRATPTIAGNFVATLGSTGLLNVIDFRSGRRVWSKDIARDNDAQNPEWGRSASPLVVDGKVVISAGGREGKSLVAYKVETGERVWSGGDDGVGYASPIVMRLLGRPQIVILNRTTLAGHDPDTGALLWSQPWVPQPNVAMPIRVADDLVLGSTGYGIGSKLVKLTAAADGTIATSFVWETPRLKAKFTNPVLLDGFVYGLDDGVLVCMDVRNGERKWRAGRYGHGQTLLVGGLLLVTTEDGDVVLVEPTPDEFRELSRFTAFDGKTWNPAAIAGKYLLVRNDKEAALYELALDDNRLDD